MNIETVSVIASASVGIAAVGSTIWTTRYSSKRTHEQTTRDLRAKAYLEILDGAQRASLHHQVKERNVNLDKYESDYFWETDPGSFEPGERPHVAALAHLYGTEEVVRRFDAWLEALSEVEIAWKVVGWNVSESGDPEGGASDEDLAMMKGKVAAHAKAVHELSRAMTADLSLRLASDR